MNNDFVVVGPRDDPANVASAKDAVPAIRMIAASGAPFLSRGDAGGTHKAERRLWQAAGVAPKAASGIWYRETGASMGATLNTATEEMPAYAPTGCGAER